MSIILSAGFVGFVFCVLFLAQFVDDDNKCYLEINYTFDIRKDWKEDQVA